MKAVIIRKSGSTEVLELTDVAKPQPKANEVLVKVHASSVNPADYKIRNGELSEIFPLPFPRILGGDFSGIVSELGDAVTNFKVGDEVFGAVPLNTNGSYAEFAVVGADTITKKPENVSHVEASSLPVVGLTSIQALRDFGKIKKNHHVLIHAGSGGVGSFAIQYAKSVGAKVFTTASAQKHDYVKNLGADVVIDYKEKDFVEVAKAEGGMDITLETIGGDHYLRSIEATKEGGAIPCIVNPPDERVIAAAKAKNITTDFMLLQLIGSDMATIAKLVHGGQIKPTVSKEYRLEDVKAAHLAIESGRTIGKLALKI